MIIEPTRIELLSHSRARVLWQGTAGRTVYIFTDGVLAFLPSASRTANLMAEMLVGDRFRIEIHEVPEDTGEIVNAISEPKARHPILHWHPVSSAKWYYAYRKATRTATEEQLGVLQHDDASEKFQFQSPKDLHAAGGGYWNFFRAEARNEDQVESARDPWPEFVPGLPPAPTGAAMTGAGGVFALALTT